MTADLPAENPKRRSRKAAADPKDAAAVPQTQTPGVPADGTQTAAAGPADPRRLKARVISLAVLIALFAVTAVLLNLPPSGEKLSLDRVLRLSLEKKVTSVTFRQQDARITGAAVIRPDNKPSGARALDKQAPPPRPEKFWTTVPRSDATFNDIFKTFFSSGVKITIDNQPLKKALGYFQFLLLALMVINAASISLAVYGRSRGDSLCRKCSSMC